MANRYWVGGAGTWDNTAGSKWALTSGGAGGQAVPTSADDVFFDATSGANTVTIGITAQARILTMTGFTGTLAFGVNKIQLSGNATTIFTGATGYSVTGTPLIESIYSGTTGTRTINPTNVTEANSISFSISAGGGAFALSSTTAVKSLDFTGFTGSWSPGSASCTFYGSLTMSSGMTLTTGTSSWTFSATSGTQVITSNGQPLNSIIQNSPGATLQLNGTTSLGTNRSFTHTAGTLDLQNTTFTIASFNSSSTNTRSIAFGTGNITCIGSSLGAAVFSQTAHTGFSYTGTPTINISVSGSSTRQVTWGFTGGSASTVLDFNFTTGSYALTFSGNPNYARSVNFTGFTGTWDMPSSGGGYRLYGSLTLSSGMTVTIDSSSSIQLQGTGTQVITSAGKTLPDMTQSVGGGTVSLADDLTLSNDASYIISSGTFSAGIYNVSMGSFSTSGAIARTINMGSGTWTMTSLNTATTAQSVWTLSGTNLTFNKDTANINIVGAGNSRINFVGGSYFYNNLNITSTTGSPVVSISGSNTFNTISSSKTAKWMLQFGSGTTTNVTTFSINGSSSSNLVTIRTDTLTAATSTLNVTNSFTTDYALVNDVTLSSSNGTITNGYISPTATNWTRGSGTNYIQIINSGTSWQVPTTWNSSNNAIHIVGAGGGGSGTTIATTTANRIGGAGGGGGGYSKLVNQTYTPNSYVFYAVGASGAGVVGATGGGTSTGGTGGTSQFGLAQNVISLVSSAVSVQNTASTTITVTVPSVSNGDLMLMYVNSAIVTNTWTTPSGWTLPTSGSTQGRAIYYRTASSEPVSYTVTQSGSTTSSATILVYSNATFDVARISTQTPAATQSPVSITPGTAGTTMVYLASSISANATFTTPTGYTPINSDSDATAPSNAIFDISFQPSGSYSGPSTTVSTGTCYVGIVSIAPTTTGSYTTATGGTGGVSSGGTTNTAGVGGTGTGGTLNYTGGTGGVSTASTTTGICSGGGGGGSAGPNGNGGNGGNGATGATSSVTGGGGGGGNGGGTSGGNGGAGLGGAGGNNADGVGGGASSTTAQPGVLGGGASGGGLTISNGSSNGLGYDIIGYYGASGGASGPNNSVNGSSSGSYGGGASGGAQGTSTTVVVSGGNGGLGTIIVLWSSGGTSYTDSITENSSLIDITSLLGQFAVSRSEDFTALDSYVATAAFATSQTEDSILDDVKTVTANFPQSITEDSILDDVKTVTANFPQSITEDSTLDDVKTVTANFPQSITEDSTLDDVKTVTANFPQSITEDSILGDTNTQQTNYSQSITEDTQLVDLYNLVTNFISSVTEATTLEDVTQAGVVFTDSIIENFTVTSVESIQATFVRLVTENINAADLNSVKTDYITAVFENVGLLDIICYNGWFKIDDNQSASWTAISTPGGAWVGVNDAQTPSWTTISTPAGAWTDINDSQTASWDTIDTSQPCN